MAHAQKQKTLERRRRCGVTVLVAGKGQARAARRLGDSRQAVMRWERARHEGGIETLRVAPGIGRMELLTVAQRKDLVQFLKEGALGVGFPTELWALPRIAQLFEAKFGVRIVASSVSRLLGRLGLSVSPPTGWVREREERAVRTWKAKRWREQKDSLHDKAE